jgi:hypothetical protein
MSDPAPLVYALLLHGVQEPDSLRASEQRFLSEAGAHVAGRGSRFAGDAIEKGQTGPDRRRDLSGSPLFLILTPLTPGAKTEEVKRAAAAFDLCATRREAWLLRERFAREERMRIDEEAWLQLVMMNVEPANEDEFNEWYETEHVARIAAVAPEFVSVQRLEAVEGAPRHHALWRLTERKAPERDPWLSASETPWTSRIRRFMRDRRRLLLAPLTT